MARVDKYFRVARQVATRGDAKDAKRHYRLGAVGIRTDGTVVMSSNVPCRHPEKLAHAEARVVKKLDFGSEVFVVRIDSEGLLKNARPCKSCQGLLRLRGIKQCYYSISETEFGVLKL
jgi:tRNA(Arg) A34 adenosine deaminase TadA